MLGSFGWTERAFSKSNLRFCTAKRSQHAVRSPYGPIPLLVLLPANCEINANADPKVTKKRLALTRLNRTPREVHAI